MPSTAPVGLDWEVSPLVDMAVKQLVDGLVDVGWGAPLLALRLLLDVAEGVHAFWPLATLARLPYLVELQVLAGVPELVHMELPLVVIHLLEPGLDLEAPALALIPLVDYLVSFI